LHIEHRAKRSELSEFLELMPERIRIVLNRSIRRELIVDECGTTRMIVAISAMAEFQLPCSIACRFAVHAMTASAALTFGPTTLPQERTSTSPDSREMGRKRASSSIT
jgi:hypothetical protein